MGAARRKKLAGKMPTILSPRSPQEIEAELAERDRYYARIDAAIDFLYAASEDAMRQVTRHKLSQGKSA
jgi:hypothetical protein